MKLQKSFDGCLISGEWSLVCKNCLMVVWSVEDDHWVAPDAGLAFCDLVHYWSRWHERKASVIHYSSILINPFIIHYYPFIINPFVVPLLLHYSSVTIQYTIHYSSIIEVNDMRRELALSTITLHQKCFSHLVVQQCPVPLFSSLGVSWMSDCQRLCGDVLHKSHFIHISKCFSYLVPQSHFVWPLVFFSLWVTSCVAMCYINHNNEREGAT